MGYFPMIQLPIHGRPNPNILILLMAGYLRELLAGQTAEPVEPVEQGKCQQHGQIHWENGSCYFVH